MLIHLLYEPSAPVNLLCASPAGVILLFCFTRLLCSHCNVANFNKVSEAAKLIYVTHWAFFLIFMSTTIPYSIAMVKVLFSPNNVLELVKPSTFRSITFPVAFQLCMYVYEVSSQPCIQVLSRFGLSTHHGSCRGHKVYNADSTAQARLY